MKKLILIVWFLHSGFMGGWQKVDLNLASSAQIALIPGIGKKIALSLVQARNKIFLSSWLEIQKIKNISDKKLRILKKYSYLGQAKIIKKNNKILKQAKNYVAPELVVPKISLVELEKLVFRHAGLAKNSLAEIKKRSRLAGWLPELVFFVDKQHKFNKKEDLNFRLAYGGYEQAGQVLGFGAKLKFDFKQLVFHHDEIALEKLGLAQHQAQQKIVEKLIKLFNNYNNIYNKLSKCRDKNICKNIFSKLNLVGQELDLLTGQKIFSGKTGE